MNITNDDALKLEGQYDLVVANPPFAALNPDGTRSARNHNMINAFIENAIKLCKDGGYIAFVCPNSWCSPSRRNTLCRVLTSYQFHILNLNECKKWFPNNGSSFTYFVLEKTKHYQPFMCVSKYNGEITSDIVPSMTRDWLPLHWNSEIKYLMSQTVDRTDLKCFPIKVSSDLHNYTKNHYLSDVQGEQHPYEIVHTFNKTRWSRKPHKYQEGWKVLITLTSNFDTRIVNNVGMTQGVAFILCCCEQQARYFQEQLHKPINKLLNDLNRFGNFNNTHILTKLPVQLPQLS
jgi:hypothetical protein